MWKMIGRIPKNAENTIDSPLVSVVMNCYNGEQYLRDAIDSVYAQTYGNWEIVFWDNASTDNSEKIAKGYRDKIRYYKSDKNDVLYKARNYAIERCKGEYIAFLDVDDVWLPSKLELQVKHMLVTTADMVATSFDIVNKKMVKEKRVAVFRERIFFNDLIKRNDVSISSVLGEAKVFKENKFNPELQLLGDFELWLRLSLKYKIDIIPDICQLSRQHESNTSKIYSNLWARERRKVISEVTGYIPKSWTTYYSVFVYLSKNEVKNILYWLGFFISRIRL
jgi:glycosyltransferase involved in cell wall biosynthesis